MTLKELYERTRAAMGIYGEDQEVRVIPLIDGNVDEYDILALSLEVGFPIIEIVEHDINA